MRLSGFLRPAIVPWLIAGQIALLAGSASADARTQAMVRSFLQEGQAQAERFTDDPQALQAFLGRSFAVTAFARRTAPSAVWELASQSARRSYEAVVLCRLAHTDVAGIDAGLHWQILGSRDTDTMSTVAVLASDAEGRARHVFFDMDRAASLIVDVRTEGGRLSHRLAQQFRLEAGDVNAGASIRGWLGRVRCEAGGR